MSVIHLLGFSFCFIRSKGSGLCCNNVHTRSLVVVAVVEPSTESFYVYEPRTESGDLVLETPIPGSLVRQTFKTTIKNVYNFEPFVMKLHFI